MKETFGTSRFAAAHGAEGSRVNIVLLRCPLAPPVEGVNYLVIGGEQKGVPYTPAPRRVH